MTFGDAIEALKIGNRVSRLGWAANKVWLELAHPCSADDAPEILSVYRGASFPWPAPHADILAEDWFIPEFATTHTDDPGAF